MLGWKLWTKMSVVTLDFFYVSAGGCAAHRPPPSSRSKCVRVSMEHGMLACCCFRSAHCPVLVALTRPVRGLGSSSNLGCVPGESRPPSWISQRANPCHEYSPSRTSTIPLPSPPREVFSPSSSLRPPPHITCLHVSLSPYRP